MKCTAKAQRIEIRIATTQLATMDELRDCTRSEFVRRAIDASIAAIRVKQARAELDRAHKAIVAGEGFWIEGDK